MPVKNQAIIKRAARHCFQTAEEAREAIGYFAIPLFPIQWHDQAQVRVAAVLLERSRSLSVVDDSENEEILPAPTTATESNAIEDIDKSTPVSTRTRKATSSARRASPHHQVEVSTSKLEHSETKSTTKPLSQSSRRIKIVLKVGSSTRRDKDSAKETSTNKSGDRPVKCGKRTRTCCEAVTENKPPVKKCRIILTITKK
ncbi:hypothetical protein ONS95_011898 [Cadophora gregata]|uniref:uncharacterized protein n=1 Tax=Cadophora gregata TaxID=51156 RepID=UPI0026DB24D4|nr:uncharacterized protein ONS95_011898 [Cadophora gregata]KAK0117562.1 hypothetical protein ONS95_011898 [Cadophora gregata]